MNGTTVQDESRTQQTPALPPRVSVLCRSMNRPELRMALDSVAAQDYPQVELVLVDATGMNSIVLPELSAPLTTVLTGGDRPLTRPQAANVALDNATGEFLLFLDEDDWIAPDHISSLVACLRSSPGTLAAYSSVQQADPVGNLLEQTFSAGFDRYLLMRDNYIPIHAVLFSRQLLTRGCRFDETLAIYEDWDFWQQCARHTDFVHLNRISAYYRQGGQSETALTDERQKYQAQSNAAKARVAVFTKWLPSWSAADLNAVLGTMDRSEVIGELEKAVREAYAHREQLLRDLDSKSGALERANLQVQDKDLQLADLRTNLQARIAQLEDHLQDRERQRQQLEQRLDDVFRSSSWRITRPWRWLGSKVRGLRTDTNNQR